MEVPTNASALSSFYQTNHIFLTIFRSWVHRGTYVSSPSLGTDGHPISIIRLRGYKRTRRPPSTRYHISDVRPTDLASNAAINLCRRYTVILHLTSRCYLATPMKLARHDNLEEATSRSLRDVLHSRYHRIVRNARVRNARQCYSMRLSAAKCICKHA